MTSGSKWEIQPNVKYSNLSRVGHLEELNLPKKLSQQHKLYSELLQHPQKLLKRIRIRRLIRKSKKKSLMNRKNQLVVFLGLPRPPPITFSVMVSSHQEVYSANRRASSQHSRNSACLEHLLTVVSRRGLQVSSVAELPSRQVDFSDNLNQYQEVSLGPSLQQVVPCLEAGRPPRAVAYLATLTVAQLCSILVAIRLHQRLRALTISLTTMKLRTKERSLRQFTPTTQQKSSLRALGSRLQHNPAHTLSCSM